MDTPAEPAPAGSLYSVTWVWEIRRKSGTVKDQGSFVGWRYAQPQAVADDQMALLVVDLAPRYHLLKGLVCRAWPEDAPEDFGESRGDDWFATAKPHLAAKPSRAA
ncbi:hypothetical protein [Phytohabitans houttuyneae]|uniref:Uncharacterized protein n=1 Tax=Phytohabitans houttuyneae TaxID=1076126 RepID=A0A6V8KBC3_9ACTN|nr:hypothetical protein [Phytohabitans houttuyneae]GFJ79449.1 hypothetical protein Phou_036290 [Phytohabitans houttuyneae]